MNYEKNTKYFTPVKYTLPIVLCIVGFLGLMSIGDSPLTGILGILMIAGGVYLYRNKKNIAQTDAQYDASVASQLSGMKGRALSKLGLDEDEVKEAAPISFDGYRYTGATMAKKGADNLWRTNKYEAVMLFFSSNEVHCYTYNFSTTEDKHAESTDVYFYKDIVSVSTTSETVVVNGNSIDYEAFKLTTAGGTSINVSLKDVENAQRSINAMRSLLKSKKQG